MTRRIGRDYRIQILYTCSNTSPWPRRHLPVEASGNSIAAPNLLFPGQFSEEWSLINLLENSMRSCDLVAVVTQIIYNTVALRSPLSLSHEFPSRGEDAHAAVFFKIET